LEKVAPNCGLNLYFEKKLSEVINRPMGENSPNLVTLAGNEVRLLQERNPN
jgi:hypothetical protein